jgi:hypothetical protein
MAGIMDLLGGGLIESVGKVVTDLVTTEKERRQLDLQDKELDQKGDLAQIDVNKTEAQSAMLFVAGWRPAVGWIGALSLGVAYIPKALVLTGLWTYQALVITYAWKAGTPPPGLPPFPDLGIMDVIGLLGSMLGMGYMRHREKLAGVATSGLPAPAAKPVNPGDMEAP